MAHHFRGWQVGTRAKGDPQSDAIRDHREVTILVRAEVSALRNLMIAKGVCDAEEFDRQIEIECAYMQQAYEKMFPGAKATDIGMTIDSSAHGWLSKFPP